MNWKLFFLSYILIILECNSQGEVLSKSFWSDVGCRTGNILRNCWKSASNNTKPSLAVISCLQRQSLLILQKTMDEDIISLGEGIKLVKWENSTKR